MGRGMKMDGSQPYIAYFNGGAPLPLPLERENAFAASLVVV